MASSSSSPSSSWLYHVFLSFRGVDVRKGFLSHVRKGLESKGIIAFVDDEIKRGESVGPVLVGAIRQSRVAVVLLSPNYSSSSWCLDELVEIMKCREEGQQTVMTIFYEVDPSDVRRQTGDFGKAFDKTCVGKTEEVKQAWMQALKDVAGIAGYHSSNCDNEAEMINKVAADVTAALGFTQSKDFDDFIGIGARIMKIKSKLVLQSEEVKVIGVVGPPGIGKTTIARVLYNQLSPGFPFSTFLENIRGSFEKTCGNDYQVKLCLQKKLLSQIFNQKDIEVLHLGVAHEKLSDKKVLVVLDEVDSWWQLEATGNHLFGPGSIIIITTEDRKILKALGLGINHIYEMKLPTSSESLQIFCQYAFDKKSPDNGFEWLAWEVTKLVGDLPLGLRVMGSYLRGMSRDYWIDALPRLRSSLDTEIETTLRFSYDVLSDKDKALFLHIACFFVGLGEDCIKNCLEKSGLDVNHGLQVLAHRSLISIEQGYIRMHCLLQQMGREIVKKQSGERQFLMDTKEISDVLEEDTGTGKVLGIKLDTSKSKKIQISKSAFQGMNNLQFLHVISSTLCIPEGLNSLPDKLTLINWKDCPLRFWPSKFSGRYLVELIMPNSKFKKLWKGIKPLHCLKVMNLSYSKSLKKIPDLSEATSLEKLYLFDCGSLLELTSSIGNATKLIFCDIRSCWLLKELPSSVGRLINLEKLDLRFTAIEKMPSSFSTWSWLYRLDMTGCRNVKYFPNVPNSIVELVLCCTGIMEVPPLIGNLFRLRKLIMYGCAKLKTISPNISKLENLEFLALSNGCGIENDYERLRIFNYFNLFQAVIKWRSDLKRSWEFRSDFKPHYIFPICLPEKALSSPISLSLIGDSLETIPDCIRSLSRLIKLDVRACKKLVALPPLPGSLLSINAGECESLERIGSSFQNPSICLYFSNCLNLNREARNLIHTSACKHAFLPGDKVPAHFTHRASSDSLTINATPTPLPSSFRFKACILLSEGMLANNSLMDVSFLVRNKQNGLIVGRRSTQLHIPYLSRYEEHLYIFEDSFSINQDFPEATFSELTFVFKLHDKTWKVKGCGVRLLEGPQCIIDGIEDDNVDDYNDGDGVESADDVEGSILF
ncbi:disease resistance-like protein DSC2 isoform X1 [Raphanus sativus]|uniref:ADP-ribosyl cyclase/cyclic ADP-ribose hydrolase n=1 Tax=Raphanus sativus TaxID=3726 RepID=A0A6J0NB63_RAPSA|nr:disease resistance-like protein DSC2 isoform X1 [Raphanus sativus]